MSITIEDCMHLPALREAKVIAGHQGMNQIVSSVSVLEYAHIYALTEELFLGNELVLTAFTSVMDSVEAQCAAISRLHKVGEVGIVLYYVGYFVPRVDPSLIALADELDFPLILMPPNTYHHRYSEVITEVLEAIYDDRKKDTYFVPQIIEMISRLRERQQTLSSVLRILSDRLRCSLLLLDRDGRERGFASWPMVAPDGFVSAFRDAADTMSSAAATTTIQDQVYQLQSGVFHTDLQRGYRIFALSSNSALAESDFSQAIEVLQMYCNIWKNHVQQETADDLVRTILNDQQITMYRIAHTLHIDLKRIRVMWVLRSKTVDLTLRMTSPEASMVKSFLQENGKLALVDAFDESIVAFMDDAKYLELDKDLAQSFVETCHARSFDVSLIWCGGMDSIQDVRLAYMMLEDFFPAACIIYPQKDILHCGN